MERTKDGWIVISEDDPETFPKTDEYILLSFENYSIPTVGRFEDGAFYVGDDSEPAVSFAVFVNAWQPLPPCYRESQE